MRVIVLGAGVIGTTSAWYLARAGHEVTVVDRQPEAALETSFANGGQISVSHSEPWANPMAPLKILRWLGREDSPLLFRPRADLREWVWGLRFLLECLPGRTRDNTEAAFALAQYSREQLGQLRRDTAISYDAATSGILHLYQEEREFEYAARQAEALKRHGLDLEIKTPRECLRIEPALEHSKVRLVGGAYAASDESGDAHLFAKSLSDLSRAQGVVFRFNVSVKGLEVSRGAIERVVIDDEAGIEESLRSDAYVIALGSYSTPLLRRIGISIPVYPVKGYSITLPLEPGSVAPRISLTDHARKIVLSRLGNRLRVAGTAELNGYDTEMNERRCAALVSRSFEWFPRAGRPESAHFWTGLRPATPSNLPLIGRSKYPNLFLNTGHGTLGWTLACGSGRALADIVSGRKPEPEFGFLGTEAQTKRATSSVAPRPTG
ncbi:MAG TPA: D-amino acid dehydrogenase [Burkholderiales bacterium]|nr:D-amino acid dehydrogenase [Burkholderiales bacterium]